MSRRRQTYRPHVSPTADELHDACFGTQARRDRSHLTVIPERPVTTGVLDWLPFASLAVGCMSCLLFGARIGGWIAWTL